MRPTLSARRLIACAALALGIVAGLTLSGLAAGPLSTSPAGVAEDLLARHNAERAARRLPALVLHPALVEAARVQAEDCARRRVLSHTGSDRSTPWDRISRQGYRWSAASENAAAGWPDSRYWSGADFGPSDAMLGWMQSPGHRANVLGSYRHFGAAVARAPNGTRYFFTTFGSPR